MQAYGHVMSSKVHGFAPATQVAIFGPFVEDGVEKGQAVEDARHVPLAAAVVATAPPAPGLGNRTFDE